MNGKTIIIAKYKMSKANVNAKNKLINDCAKQTLMLRTNINQC